MGGVVPAENEGDGPLRGEIRKRRGRERAEIGTAADAAVFGKFQLGRVEEDEAVRTGQRAAGQALRVLSVRSTLSMTTSFTPALKLRRRSFSGKRWKMPPRAPLSASVAVMRPLT